MALAQPENYIGDVISSTIAIEKFMDKLLSQHFCSTSIKREEFSNMILFNERITFDFKKGILTILIKKHHRSILKDYPKLLKLLSDIPEHRNRFAHLETVGYRHSSEITHIIENNIPVYNGIDQEKFLDMSHPYYIIFKGFKNGQPKYIGYGLPDIMELNKNAAYVVEGFRELFNRITNTITAMPPEQSN